MICRKSRRWRRWSWRRWRWSCDIGDILVKGCIWVIAPIVHIPSAVVVFIEAFFRPHQHKGGHHHYECQNHFSSCNDKKFATSPFTGKYNIAVRDWFLPRIILSCLQCRTIATCKTMQIFRFRDVRTQKNLWYYLGIFPKQTLQPWQRWQQRATSWRSFHQIIFPPTESQLFRSSHGWMCNIPWNPAFVPNYEIW